MQLGKLASGLLFESAFVTEMQSDWVVSPSAGSHTWTAGQGLKLTGNAYALHQIPQDTDFTLQLVATDVTPGVGTCGLVLYREDNYQVRMSVFADAGLIPMNMLIRCTDGVYTFFAGNTGNWQVIGSIRDDLLLYMGCFVADGATLTMGRASCTHDEDLLVQGLTDGDLVELDNGVTVISSATAENGVALIELRIDDTFGVSGNLKVTSGGAVAATVSATFYPGDAWTVALPVSIAINNTVVPFGGEYTITALEASETVLSVDIHNETTVALTGHQLRVMSQTPYAGVEWADVALDNAGVPGVWANVVTVPDLAPATTVRVWVRVLRDAENMFYTSLPWAKFRVVFI